MAVQFSGQGNDPEAEHTSQGRDMGSYGMGKWTHRTWESNSTGYRGRNMRITGKGKT